MTYYSSLTIKTRYNPNFDTVLHFVYAKSLVHLTLILEEGLKRKNQVLNSVLPKKQEL